MKHFKIGTVEGVEDTEAGYHGNGLNVSVQPAGDNFVVAIGGISGPVTVNYQLHPEQSRRLRKLLEDAEAKAEILTAAI